MHFDVFSVVDRLAVHLPSRSYNVSNFQISVQFAPLGWLARNVRKYFFKVVGKKINSNISFGEKNNEELFKRIKSMNDERVKKCERAFMHRDIQELIFSTLLFSTSFAIYSSRA